MSDNRICPVCEKEIPEDARYFCPFCRLNLRLIQNNLAVQRARQNYYGEITQDQGNFFKWTPYLSVVLRITGRRKHYIAGVLVSLFVGFLFVQGYFAPLYFCIVFLPFGTLAGFVGNLLEKKSTKTSPQMLGLVILTIILSFLFSFGVFNIIVIFFHLL